MLRSALTVSALAGALVLAVGAGPASAAQPCWRAVVNDWYDNDRIDAQYQVHCYRETLQHLTSELKIYSDLPEKVGRALQAAITNQARPAPPRQLSGHRIRSPIGRVLDELGPKRADSLPVPLLVLAGLAMLLIAAGAVGMVTRRLHARRVRPGPPD
jgi:hypothetical protein